jgi:hypothetical protein
MSLQTILNELRERYATLTSYQDVGVVLSQLPGLEAINETTFLTCFTRPNRFRFDWNSHHPYPPLRDVRRYHRLWQNANGVFSHYHWAAEPKQVSDIGRAISGAKGVSGGSSYTIPRMLTGTTGEFASDFLTVQAITDGETEGLPCRCVIAVDSRKRPHRLYVGRDDLLLYRISCSVMDGSTSDEIHREIRVDLKIGEEIFTQH